MSSNINSVSVSFNSNDKSSQSGHKICFESESSPQESTFADLEKIEALKKSLNPLTLPYEDSQGYTFQLWKYKNNLIASVWDHNGDIRVLSGKNVHNALQPQETNLNLLNRLEKVGLKKWHFAFLKNAKKIYLWPLLIAAGRDDSDPKIYDKPSQLGHLYDKRRGHLPRDNQPGQPIRGTPEGEALLKDAKKPEYRKGTDNWGGRMLS